MKKDWRTAPLSERERAICAYTDKLTRTPWELTRADLEPLKAAGLDDRGILQVNLIGSWFNYINRVADGLGVGRP